MSTSLSLYTIDSVLSKDGTKIGYRQVGSGPGLVLLHGGMQAAQNYMRLANALAEAFTVYVPDRRGRGLSGPHGEQYAMAKECQDVEAILEKTGAHFVFGHSSGGLIALQAGLTLPAIQKVAVYEPALSLDGSIPFSWVPRFEREIASGKVAAALLTVGKGLDIAPEMTRIPRWLLLPLLMFLLRSNKQALKPDDVPMEKLIPTMHFDVQLAQEMDGSLGTFKAMRAEVLLMEGAKSPAYLRAAIAALQKTLPHVRSITYPDLDHAGPNESAPERIASDMSAFFSQPSVNPL